MFNRNDYGIWFDSDSAHATLPVRYVDPEEGLDEDDVEFEIDLHVGGWEHSYYRPSERDFEIQDVRLEAFGRVYHFDLDEVIQLDSERSNFLDALERAYDNYADECRADMLCD